MLASLLSVHHNTLQYKLHEMGLHKHFSTLTDDELDHIIKFYKHLRPTSGVRYTTGFLQRHGLQIQREHIRKSLQCVDKLGQALRQHDAIMCCTYISQMSNAIWHLDGLHKLIQYGLVIHGTVDGHDHVVSEYIDENLLHLIVVQVVGLCVSESNSASTVLLLFLSSISEFGCPSCVHGDRGGENIDVAVWMIMHQGLKCYECNNYGVYFCKVLQPY